MIDFARGIRARQPDATLAIQCDHGRSLSPAFALAVLADELGTGREAEAVQCLLNLDRDGIMAPNPLVVQQADDRLWCYGALAAASAAASPRFAAVRDYWSRVASPAGAHAAPRRQGNRKRRIRALDHDEREVWE